MEERKNKFAEVLTGFGWFLIVLALFVAPYLGTVTAGSNSIFNWGTAFVTWGFAIIFSLLLFGLAEVIEQLTRVNEKMEKNREVDGL
ncbi:hypothetical protein QYG89_05965 [Bacillus sp. B190/17]|uniref:Uncharacterized protein n=1 Tax=Bacillus lumedeiriae TaxID=3058829 RepID=A0ABW8I7Q2_9BACI